MPDLNEALSTKEGMDEELLDNLLEENLRLAQEYQKMQTIFLIEKDNFFNAYAKQLSLDASVRDQKQVPPSNDKQSDLLEMQHYVKINKILFPALSAAKKSTQAVAGALPTGGPLQPDEAGQVPDRLSGDYSENISCAAGSKVNLRARMVYLERSQCEKKKCASGSLFVLKEHAEPLPFQNSWAKDFTYNCERQPMYYVRRKDDSQLLK
ncbi:hypothetical protein H920_12712 [Fukomys damarensis]|uniref:Uncharacterized protein n=1 Tax=Fukomys damarensis TaxID=885580 RepID=A0A091D5W8_FUKDA|nr:hypothetical protein H920_12712 [Fukomys damarensis]